MAKVEVSRAGWFINPVELQKACEWLELAYPVHVRMSNGRRTAGTHRISYGDTTPVHRITISQNVWLNVVYDANETLWHELVHAQQAERWEEATGELITAFYRKAYLPAGGAWGKRYVDNLYEKGARDKAAWYNTHRPRIVQLPTETE